MVFAFGGCVLTGAIVVLLGEIRLAVAWAWPRTHQGSAGRPTLARPYLRAVFLVVLAFNRADAADIGQA